MTRGDADDDQIVERARRLESILSELRKKSADELAEIRARPHNPKFSDFPVGLLEERDREPDEGDPGGRT